MTNKTIIFVPCDQSEQNSRFYGQFERSLRKFHPDVELRRVDNPDPQDTDFWYRAKPLIASELFKEGYTTVIGADADQIVLGSLQDVLEDTEDYDVGVVLNDPSWSIQIWDIQPVINNGFVIMKNAAFVEHWKRLCLSAHFPKYQYREQDLLNILASDYGNYRVKFLETDKLYGECAKPFLASATLEDGKVMIPTPIGSKQLCLWHAGGGNTADKGNFRIRFSPEVVTRIEELIT